MIELKNVTFAYDEKPILKNISFYIDDNDSIVIMGSSGSGKSTILRLILGLECPQSGEVLIDGENICVMAERQKQEIRKQIGMVFQDGALFDSMTVGENVAYYLLEHTKLSWNKVSERACEMLGFVGLDPDEYADKLPAELSGGQRRRVAIGRALLSTNPRIMLYDEPTTGLDPAMSQNVLNLITKLQNERGIASVIVSHHIADSLLMANRFVVIYEGEIAFDGDYEGLRCSVDRRVQGFLQPFRTSFARVAEKKFVAIHWD